MATAIKLQRLSKFADRSEVLEWLKAPGDAVRAGEALVAVLSDKATVEIAAPVGGVLLSIAVSAGAQVPAGTVLAWIGEPGEMSDEAERAAAFPPERRAGPSDVGRDTALEAGPAPTIGSKVRAVPAARRLAAEMGVALETLTGSGPGGIVTALDVERAVQRRVQPAATDAHEIRPTGHPRITPVARRFAQEHGLDIDQIAGTGPGGEVVKADVEHLLHARQVTTFDASAGQEEGTVLPLQGFARSMAQRMTASHQVIVQATTVADVDMTEIVHLRAHIPASYTAFVIKAAAQAVAEFPLINASLEEESIVLKKHVDMGVAVATDAGLVVPVLRHVEERSLADIHRALESLSNRARDRALGIEELGSPSMTVTNSGVFGSLLFTPIIVAPQSATLGMGKVMPTVVVRENQMVIREIMYLCLSYDHRIIDGSVAVRYLQRIKAHLEEPLPLLWDEGAS